MPSQEANEKIVEKLGEAIGLEMAAQKAVDQLISEGLLDVRGIKRRVQGIRKEAERHQKKMQQLAETLSTDMETENGEGAIDMNKVEEKSKETEQKVSQMMQTYLGDSPNTQEALEFLCMAEGGEVTHYEVLNAMSKQLRNTEFSARVRSILKEERAHLKECLDLAKGNIADEMRR